MAEDDDAAWEQLAAEIQASEQVAAASMGHPSGRRNGSRPPTRAGAPTPQGPSGVPQDGAAAGAEAGNQQAAADLQLQAAMQEAIDGESGWGHVSSCCVDWLPGGLCVQPEGTALYGWLALCQLSTPVLTCHHHSAPLNCLASVPCPLCLCRGRPGCGSGRRWQLDAGSVCRGCPAWQPLCRREAHYPGCLSNNQFAAAAAIRPEIWHAAPALLLCCTLSSFFFIEISCAPIRLLYAPLPNVHACHATALPLKHPVHLVSVHAALEKH